MLKMGALGSAAGRTERTRSQGSGSGMGPGLMKRGNACPMSSVLLGIWNTYLGRTPHAGRKIIPFTEPGFQRPERTEAERIRVNMGKCI